MIHSINVFSAGFASISEKRLKQELDDYRKDALSNIDTLDGEEYWYTNVIENKHIGLLSWRHLLQFLLLNLGKASDISRISDVRQLLGLAEKTDDLAFMPLRSEELSSDIARRYYDYTSLVDEISRKSENLGYS